MYIIFAECQKEKELCNRNHDLPLQCCEGLTCMAMNGTTNECIKKHGMHLKTVLTHSFVLTNL